MHIYDREACHSQASRLLAAVLWGKPHLQGPLRHAFPRPLRSLSGWRRLEPPSSRPLVSRDVARLVAAALHAHGQCHMGLLGLVLLENYRRPSEALVTAPSQAIAPDGSVQGACRKLSFIVDPEECERPNQVNEYDQSVTVVL